MKTIKLRSRVGSDGTLHLNLPVGLSDTELEITVTIEAIEPETGEELGWSPQFFERTAGAWEEESMVRELQEEYEQREEIF